MCKGFHQKLEVYAKLIIFSKARSGEQKQSWHMMSRSEQKIKQQLKKSQGH